RPRGRPHPRELFRKRGGEGVRRVRRITTGAAHPLGQGASPNVARARDFCATSVRNALRLSARLVAVGARLAREREARRTRVVRNALRLSARLVAVGARLACEREARRTRIVRNTLRPPARLVAVGARLAREREARRTGIVRPAVIGHALRLL